MLDKLRKWLYDSPIDSFTEESYLNAPVIYPDNYLSNKPINDVIEPSLNSNSDEHSKVFSSEFLLYNSTIAGWSNEGEQISLFASLLLFYKASQSILDIGCARGDLFGYMQDSYLANINYKGIDYNPNVLKIAEVKYPNIDVNCVDLFDLESNITTDWVVASGIFNFKDCENMEEYVEHAVSKMIKHAKVGIAFNLNTSDNDDDLIVYDGGKWLNYLKQEYGNVVSTYSGENITFIIFI